MAIDYAPEFGTRFELLGPDGTSAVFNDQTDSNYVGVLSNISGLDSAEVRESGDTLVEFDGGVQGPGYYGRRPIVLEGLVYGHSTAAARAAKLAKLHKATNAMRSDSYLYWTPSTPGAVPVFLKLRRQQPLRIDGAWNKTFQAAMVAADPRICSSALNTASTTTSSPLVVTNEGNAEAWPIYTLMGPSSSTITIANAGTGLNIVTSTTLGFNDVLYIDTLNRTVNKASRALGSRKNYFKNPTVTGGTLPTTGISASQAIATPSITAGEFLSGSRAIQIDPTGTSGNAGLLMTDAVPGVTAGRKVGVSVSYLNNSASNTSLYSTLYQYKNSGGTVIDTQQRFANGVGEDPSLTTWKRYWSSTTAPANTASVDISFIFGGPLGSGTATYQLTDFVIETDEIPLPVGVTAPGGPTSTIASFFDGSHPASGYTGLWTGTTDNSISLSYKTNIDATIPLVPFYSCVNFAATRWSGLVPNANSLTAGWTTSSPGALFKVEWRHTWL